MDSNSAIIDSVAMAASSEQVALNASPSPLPPLPPSAHAAQVQDASLNDTSTELSARKRLQPQAPNMTKRPRSTIFDTSSTTVSHWSKRPRKPTVLKPTTSLANGPRAGGVVLASVDPARAKLAITNRNSQGGGAQHQDDKENWERMGQGDPASSVTNLMTAKAITAVCVSSLESKGIVLARRSSGEQQRLANETRSSVSTATTVAAAATTTVQTRGSASSSSSSSSSSSPCLSRSSSTAASTYSPSSLAPSPFATPSLASLLSISKPTTLPRKPSNLALNASLSSSTFSRSSSLLSSTISPASGPSRTSSTSSLSSIFSLSTSSSLPPSRSSSSSSLRRGQSVDGTIQQRHTLARSSSLHKQTSLVGSLIAKLQPLEDQSSYTDHHNTLPMERKEDTEPEDDYSFLVTPSVLAVSDQLLSMSRSGSIDDLEALLSQESSCDECSSCLSSIPLPCPDFALRPLEDRSVEWHQNHQVKDSQLTRAMTETKASAREQEESANSIRPIHMSRAKTTQATSFTTFDNGASSLSTPPQRPHGFRRHKTMQGIKNEYKVASAAQDKHNSASVTGTLSAADQTQPPTTLPGHDTEENQILPFTDPPSGSNDFAKRISPTTMVDVLEGRYKQKYDVLMIIDCRFSYEYKGGHIQSAINIHDKKELGRVLFEPPLADKKVLLILHCEFSCERGPGMAKHVRSLDRTANSIHYPALYYPELYVLDGGYSKFFAAFSDYCTPRGYVQMLDAAYSHEYELARKAHRSAFGRTASKGFLGMESLRTPKIGPSFSPASRIKANNGHGQAPCSTVGMKTSNTCSSNDAGGKDSKTVSGRGLRGRAKTIPDLRTVAKLNLDQFRLRTRDI